MFLKKKIYINTISIFLLGLSPAAMAEQVVWKVTIISALPSRQDVPLNYCQQFSPDVYVGPDSKLQQEGVKAQNGMLVKYRTVQTQQQNQLFFTSIDAVISKQLDPSHSWYTRFYIHLQQLTLHGIADGVWSTLDCKGRLIAQPEN
jgi:hypothetical protein